MKIDSLSVACEVFLALVPTAQDYHHFEDFHFVFV